jgi:1-deoxy-D-xylulose-5-phosphate synthase
MVEPASRIAERLDATLLNMRFIKPLDRERILTVARTHSAIVTLEENVVAGGAGSGVGELLAAEGFEVPLLHIGIPDRFIEHGSREDCLAAAGLDFASLLAAVEGWWARGHGERSTRSESRRQSREAGLRRGLLANE